MENISIRLKKFIQILLQKNSWFYCCLIAVVSLTILILSPSLKISWRLIDDAENLRMGQEIDQHLKSGDYTWILTYEKDNGRFRPTYWAWHYLTYKTSNYNAYRHHLIHLLLYLGIMTMLYLITQKISGSSFGGLLAVVFLLFFKSIGENLYRLGTAEPQVTFLVLFLIWRLCKLYFEEFSKKNPVILKREYIFNFLVIGILYFMKETALVVIPTYCSILAIGFIDKNILNKRAWFNFIIRIFIFNFLFLLLTLGLKSYYYSGSQNVYASLYSLDILGMIKRFFVYIKMFLIDYNLVLVIPAVSFLYFLRNKMFNSQVLWQLAILANMVVYLSIQIPWPYALGRYLMPVAIWLAVFLGIETGRMFLPKNGFKLNLGKKDSSFEIPLKNIIYGLLVIFFVLWNGKSLFFMYKSVLKEERANQNMIRYIIDNVSDKENVYVNFRDESYEYLYELSLHFKLFYNRPNLHIDYLNLGKGENQQSGNLIISFKNINTRYPWSEIMKLNGEEIRRDEFSQYWQIYSLK